MIKHLIGIVCGLAVGYMALMAFDQFAMTKFSTAENPNPMSTPWDIYGMPLFIVVAIIVWVLSYWLLSRRRP